MADVTNVDAAAGAPGPVVLWRPGAGSAASCSRGSSATAWPTRVNIGKDAGARDVLNDRIGSETVPSVLMATPSWSTRRSST